MGALLSLPLLAIPSASTVRCHWRSRSDRYTDTWSSSSLSQLRVVEPQHVRRFAVLAESFRIGNNTVLNSVQKTAENQRVANACSPNQTV
jgi:hypothetical protein